MPTVNLLHIKLGLMSRRCGTEPVKRREKYWGEAPTFSLFVDQSIGKSGSYVNIEFDTFAIQKV